MDYFVEIPLKYVNCDLEEAFPVSPCIYSVYFIISDRRNRYGQTNFCMRDLLNLYGVECTPRKPKLFKDIITSLQFLETEGLIAIEQELSKIKYDTLIRVQIKPNFDTHLDSIEFSKSELENILNIDTTISKDILIHSFLYIKSYIFKKCYSSETLSPAPKAFFKSIRSSAKEIGISKNTFHSCIKTLCEGNNALLVSGSRVPNNEGQPFFAPRAIVLNKPGWEDELLAANKLLERKRA